MLVPVDEDEDLPRSPPDTTLYTMKDALDILELIYMIVLYLVQFCRDRKYTLAEIEADIEDTAIIEWPQALPAGFLNTLEYSNLSPCFSLLIQAYFYLILSLLESSWFLKGVFDEEILKMGHY